MTRIALLFLGLVLCLAVSDWPRADHHDDPGGAAAIFAAESVGLRGRQPERPRLQRRLSVLQQHLQRSDPRSVLRYDRLRPQMLQPVQGMPQLAPRSRSIASEMNERERPL